MKAVYAVGDIHGCLDLLVQLQDKIAQDITDRGYTDITVVYLGDYVDRGPDTKGVIDRLLNDPLAALGASLVHLEGNHEETMIRALWDPVEHPDFWFRIGGRAVAQSYGVNELPEYFDEAPFEARGRLLPLIPLEHQEFLRTLLVSYAARVGGQDYFFAHAGVLPGHPLHRQDPEWLKWVRNEFVNSTEDFGAIVVHGHTIRKDPEVKPNRIGIDTGSYKYGRITALVLDEASGPRFIFASKPE